MNNGAGAIARIVGGGLGDRLRRHKEVASVGYALSAVTRPAFLFVGNVFSAIVGIVLVERVGKGIRTAPRDAMISLSTPPEHLGTAFGVHRALDTTGAMLGPLVAFAVLASMPGSYDAVFIISFAVAVIGVAVIVLLVEPQRGSASTHRPPLSRSDVLGLVRLPRYRSLTMAATVLSLATISDAFIYLYLQRSLDFDVRFLPLLFVATAASYMVFAIPLGQLADRVGRPRVFIGGYATLLGVYCLMLSVPASPLSLCLLLPLLGIYYAATDGVLAAATTAVLPEHVRGTGLAMLTTGTSLGRLGGSIAFGALWYAAGASAAVAIFAVALAVALVGAYEIIRRTPARDDAA